LEFNLKQKAQLKYFQQKQKRSAHRIKILQWLSHEYLWSPTPLYYIVTFFSFLMVKKRFAMKPYSVIPFMMIPVTMDYVSKILFVTSFAEREFYVGSFQDDKKRLSQTRRVVHQIVQEKKKHVRFEQVLRFVTGVSLDEYIDERPILPSQFD